MKKTFLGFVLDQWSTVPAVESVDLSGKTVVVVGANTGIGLEAAKHFARMCPTKLILGCRSESRGQSAVSEIERATGFKACESWKVDLADFASVTSFGERFQRECDRLDILVMNAGVLAMEYEATVDGWESSLQVNHLGTALLSLLLLPRLVDTGKKFGSTSRLVIVASEVHYWAILHADVKESDNPVAKLSGPDYRDPSSMRGRYHETKLLNVLFARALQDRIQSITPLTVNAANPGYCYSNLRRNFRGVMNAISFIMETCLARTSEEGGRQLVYAAVGKRNNEDDMKGAYISNTAVVEPSDFVISEEGRMMQDNVWRETIEILTKEAPHLTSTVQEYLV
ncbi:NAD(P)-binding protein [Imleria badia]|nr:NAD(P)-binding protein [Imleria badia]